MAFIYQSQPMGLPESLTANGSSASSELAGSLGGRANYLTAMARGTAGAAQNPQGTYGVDHSGPPYGVAFQHTLAAFSGQDAAGLTNVYHNAERGGGTVNMADEPVKSFTVDVYVKPFPPSDGTPYSRLFAFLMFEADVATDVTFRVTTSIGSTERTQSVGAGSVTGMSIDDLSRVEPGINTITVDVIVTNIGEHKIRQWSLEQIERVKHV